MPIPLFEGACAGIIALTLWVMALRRPRAELLRDYALLALGAWLGEQSCILLYHFYEYSPLWHGRVGQVPILVPLIWPLVVLSACEVARALWPRLPAAAAAAVAAAIVALDASLVEVIAVRAGLWRWTEPGYLGVPLIGILGWGYFALGAAWGLARLRGSWRLLIVGLAPLCAHALILLSWWSLFRFALRGELAAGAQIGMVAIGIGALLAVLRQRRRGPGLPLAVGAPRMIAASLFVFLLLSPGPGSERLWLHTAAVAIPYCAAMRWRAVKDEAQPR